MHHDAQNARVEAKPHAQHQHGQTAVPTNNIQHGCLQHNKFKHMQRARCSLGKGIVLGLLLALLKIQHSSSNKPPSTTHHPPKLSQHPGVIPGSGV